MPSFSASTVVLTIAIVLLFARPAHAFGAGNIASVARIEGSNWRHGDIEDTLLTLLMSRAAGGKKFDKLSVARVYFGNWLRDYSQAIDVGTVKYVSAEAIRILLWVLGFMTFGYGTKEFEVTAERLGCYRPEDHIDNPKDYADNIDATQYDPRLRGLVDERVELAIDPQTGMKNYIANERAGIMTSALHVRKLFGKCIQLGRSYARTNNKAELYESLRLLGTGLHCLEDFSAHSNYTELALIEMGERDVFPHVGRRTQIRLQGARGEVFPLITGTFGGVDFLHSVMGEFDDKTTQSEVQELEGTMQSATQGDTSILKDILSQIPEGIFGGKDEAGKADELQANATAAQMNQMRVSPRQPEEFTRQMLQTQKEIYPIIEWHDELMQQITEAIEKIPILPDLISTLEDQVNIFVFSLIAPLVLPIIQQVKNELNTGSSEIIQSSLEKQHIVFNDDSSTDPTHSMLSKDHFSNILNEPAGKIASQVLKWVVPQLMQAIDNPQIDADRTINRIIAGVFHHPAQRSLGQDGAADCRGLMFSVVENWWREQDQNEMRQKLSRSGVENGENHKPGVEDHGHGCGKPLGMHKQNGGAAPLGSGLAAGMMGELNNALGTQSSSSNYGGGYNSGGGSNTQVSNMASQAVGGGALGGLVGALAGGVSGSLLSGVLGGSNDDDERPQTQAYTSQGYNSQGQYQQSFTEVGHQGNTYAQAQVTQTHHSGGRVENSYQEFEQPSGGYGGGSGGGYLGGNRRQEESEGYEQSTFSSRQHERRGEEGGFGGGRRGEGEAAGYYGSSNAGRGEEESVLYGENRGGRGGREEYGGGRNEYGGGRGGREQEEYGGGRNEYGGGRQQEEYGSGRNEYGNEGRGGGGYGGSRNEESEGYGGGRNEEEQEEYGGGRRRRGGEDYEEEQEERREEGGGGGWFS